FTVTPTNSVNYQFSDASGGRMFVDVTKNGEDLGHVSDVTFIPGVDSIGVQFTEGKKITVTPTWTTALSFHNKVDLVANLEGTLKVGELAFGVMFGAYGEVKIGPLLEQPVSIPELPLATVFDHTFEIPDTTKTQILPSFEIGSTFKPSLKVSHTDDEKG